MKLAGRIVLVSGVAMFVAVGIVVISSAPSSAPPRQHHSVRTAAMAMPMPMPMPMPKRNATPQGVSAPEHGPPLPPGTTHGLAHRLRQYPAVFLATGEQRAAAERLRRRFFASAQRWADPRAAAAAGFGVRRPRRTHDERRVMWFHSENRAWHAARGSSIEPDRPDTLIYADLPGRPLKLVGVMISMPRGVRGPTPGGPITRWHYHLVCVAGDKRGLAPRGDGTCPTGSTLHVGSEMMHIWFTRDLRSAFAIHAPWPELCAGHVLPTATCASGKRFIGM
jgi:hypothetical protein